MNASKDLTSAFTVYPETTESAYGGLATDAPVYRPLDVVTVDVRGRARGDARCTLRVCDSEQRCYVDRNCDLTGNRGTFQFRAGGPLGAHYVYLVWPGESRHSRYVNFRLDCDTRIRSGDPAFDDLYPLTRDKMLLGRREYETPAGRFVGYTSADTLHFDGIWLRDWIYGLPAYRYWETEMTCGLDRFVEQQQPDGMIPDGIERDGRTWRVGLESDVEYILTMGVWQTWQATGDDRWLSAVLPALERALDYIRRDSKHWDANHALVKRQHSCDTWDFDIEGAADSGKRRHVIATCDQSGYVLAFSVMARMHARLGDTARAEEWREAAAAYRRRVVALLWDGEKFLHHVHLDPIDHGDFDETRQLAMGNTWAMTRGLADADQARRIIDLYRERHAQTGDAHPWWSLQPGYPDRLGYFTRGFRRQGGYANGGLMPWVGGELCRAAFRFGREAYGVELLRNYVHHLKTTGGAKVWYWPNGEPGFRTHNEVDYAPWGMAEWVHAAVEGLAGIDDVNGQFRAPTIAPRWTAAGVETVSVAVRYAASKAYAAYQLHVDPQARSLTLRYTGSDRISGFRLGCGGKRFSCMESESEETESAVSSSSTPIRFRLMLPSGQTPNAVRLNGVDLPFRIETEGDSRYACFEAIGVGVLEMVMFWKQDYS